jgi:hypothetical protein
MKLDAICVCEAGTLLTWQELTTSMLSIIMDNKGINFLCNVRYMTEKVHSAENEDSESMFLKWFCMERSAATLVN